ncbi:Arm DNA-binding domain-containing protein [Kitasatospora sp. NPDC048722]|uniref:Arm DNA-binding domain-containing protein n=1 Tax=Kitasatospora sp. NPDC048722 TaxID=3155639 RepID=UPI0033F037EC
MRLLKDTEHGSWTYCVDLAPEDGRRRTRHRGGFATEAEAAQELAAVLEGGLNGAYEERRATVAEYLREWIFPRAGSDLLRGQLPVQVRVPFLGDEGGIAQQGIWNRDLGRAAR